jgi:hypothetical protein
MNRTASNIAGAVGIVAMTVVVALMTSSAPETEAPGRAIAQTTRVARAHSHPFRATEDLGAEPPPSVLVVPTITIFGEAPRHETANLPRPAKSDARTILVATP